MQSDGARGVVGRAPVSAVVLVLQTDQVQNLQAKPKLRCKVFTEKITLFRSVLAVPAYLDGKEIPAQSLLEHGVTYRTHFCIKAGRHLLCAKISGFEAGRVTFQNVMLTLTNISLER